MIELTHITKQYLNFTAIDDLNLEVGDGEIVGIIQEGEMPPAIYLPMHPSAQLTGAEKQQLITGLSNSLP